MGLAVAGVDVAQEQVAARREVRVGLEGDDPPVGADRRCVGRADRRRAVHARAAADESDVVPWRTSRANTSLSSSASPVARLPAVDSNVTMEPRPLMSGFCESPIAGRPSRPMLASDADPVDRSWTKTSRFPSPSSADRLLAELVNATWRPSGLIAGWFDVPAAASPPLRLARRVALVDRSRTNTSWLSAPSSSVRLFDALVKATKRPSALSDGCVSRLRRERRQSRRRG